MKHKCEACDRPALHPWEVMEAGNSDAMWLCWEHSNHYQRIDLCRLLDEYQATVLNENGQVERTECVS